MSVETTPEKSTRTRTEGELPWSVVVLNDPVNLMSYVVMVFKKVFGYDNERARKHMLEVHHEGRSIVWTGGREQAEAYVHELQRWQLQAILEATPAVIVIDIQMAPELGELFAAVISGVIERLQEDLPRALFVPEDPDMAVFWSEDLKNQLREDAARLGGLLTHPEFGQGEMNVRETEAEALCRASSAVRLALRELELGQLSDVDLESGLVQPQNLEEPTRRAYYCYWFLGGLQEMLIRALDPSLGEGDATEGEDGEEDSGASFENESS